MTTLPSLSLLNQINQFIRERKGMFSLNYGLFLLGYKSGLRVSEAISFDYHLKHSRHKNLYLVNGKGNKTRYVYVSREIVQELKSNYWKPNQTNRFAFGGFLKKVKEKLNIPANVELTPHTLRRCFTTHNALSGVPLPILQKALGHANIRTTSGYWKGSIDIREFSEWLKPSSSPEEPDKVPEVKITATSPETPPIPFKLEKPDPNGNREPELLKIVAKLKGELAQKDKRLEKSTQQISLLTAEKEKLRKINQEKNRQLTEYKEKTKELQVKNNSLLQNYVKLKNAYENTGKSKENNKQLIEKPQPLEISPKNKTFLLIKSPILKIKERQDDSLVTEENNQTGEQLRAEVQVNLWKPPN